MLEAIAENSRETECVVLSADENDNELVQQSNASQFSYNNF